MVSAASRMVEGDLVGRLLALGAFHHGDHAVEEGFAGIGGDAHHQPVGQHLRAAGDGAEVAAGFADHRRRFAGDGALVHRGHAFDHLAVRRDDVAGLHQHHVAAAQAAAGDLGPGGAEAAARSASWPSRRAGSRAGKPAWALLRPSAMASAKLANSTVNHSHSETARMKPAGASPWPPRAWTNRMVVRMLPIHTTNITGFFICCTGVSFLNESTSACCTIWRSNTENVLILLVISISPNACRS